MRRTHKVICVAAAILLFCTFFGTIQFLNWYHTAPFRVWGENISINYSGRAYVINEISGAVEGDTHYVISGEAKDVFSDGAIVNGFFQGLLYIDDFPSPLKDIMNGQENLATMNDRFLDIYCYSYESSGDLSFAYTVCFNRANPNSHIIQVTDPNDPECRYFIVPGANQDDALRQLNNFLTSRFGDDYPEIEEKQ